MRTTRQARVATSASRVVAVASLCAACLLLAGCGDSVPPPPVFGGGGSVGTGGSGGLAGAGGMVGGGGESGGGGTVGLGGTAGDGGSLGGGGTGGSLTGCVTNALCHTCPASTCSTDGDCPFGGICVPSGCTFDGAPQKECQAPPGPSCETLSDCLDPDPSKYECDSPYPSAPKQCLRTAPGCSGETETYDCPLGFSCENGECVDRRVPCGSVFDCPKGHVCPNPPTPSTSNFCVRAFRDCNAETDCSGTCADVDGDGRSECTGPVGEPCANADCTNPNAPVCEPNDSGTSASCGLFGLCLNDTDCAADFVCVALSRDGRKECVPNGTAGCTSSADCPIQQTCASPRVGINPPSCQSGTAP